LADDTVGSKVKNASYPAWPAVHHQKLVIIDGKYAFTGGLNVTNQYMDTRKHEKPDRPWHDAFVKVEGSLVLQDLIRNYIGLWNQERVRAEAFLNNAYSSWNTKATPTIRPTTNLKSADVPAPLTSTVLPKISSQVHRTISKKGTDPTGIPITVREDVLEGYVQAIAQAEDFIYLENQYFREQMIADAIIQPHKAKPQLQTIILLPNIIEEFLNSVGDELSLHGAALQWLCTKKASAAQLIGVVLLETTMLGGAIRIPVQGPLQFELLDSMKTKIGANLGLFAPECASPECRHVPPYCRDRS
jgi:hypothetical protein